MDSAIFDSNREIIKNAFEINDEAVDMLAFEASRLKELSRIGKHTFLYHGLLSILTNVWFPLR